jgi:hypothetical protein
MLDYVLNLTLNRKLGFHYYDINIQDNVTYELCTDNVICYCIGLAYEGMYIFITSDRREVVIRKENQETKVTLIDSSV